MEGVQGRLVVSASLEADDIDSRQASEPAGRHDEGDDVAADAGHAAAKAVGADHDEAMRAERGDAAAASRAAMDGDVLPDDGVRTNDNRGLFALVAKVLRLATDHGKTGHARTRSDCRAAADHYVSVERHAIFERDIAADDRKRADSHIGAEARAILHDRGRMNETHADAYSVGTIPVMI